ncbi:hypothetical protein TCAL_07018 [Tigriopus californicus]|uniref:G-protein coupled receptors family 1 profile domain-containing protein n=2 Tax=Tigriopus californicus TaxID=6832 RepID=A0A553PBJ3_TIGCA|nr:hypothetical protein TCAL_07018 [Tigriopus californicus]
MLEEYSKHWVALIDKGSISHRANGLFSSDDRKEDNIPSTVPPYETVTSSAASPSLDDLSSNESLVAVASPSSFQSLFDSSVNFSSRRQNDFSMFNNAQEAKPHYEIIFNGGEQAVLLSVYGIILVLGLVSNAAIIWVVLARKQNQSPRNMYIVNLAISGIVMTIFCIPPTLLQILYGGWWHMGVIACKLVPVIQGANILVSAFSITVIAVDRWKSVSNTSPNAVLTYKSVFGIIAIIWMFSFLVTSPLLIYQTVNRMHLPNTDIVLMQVCTEQFPKDFYKHGFTVVILLVQYVVPLIVLPIVHAKILLFLRRNSGFQTDPRRREREERRNRRMTKILSCIGVIYAISWMPLHLYLILTDIFSLFQDNHTFYLVLGLCHAVAMSSSFTNPIMYGWFNTSLRSELESLLPIWCQNYLSSAHPDEEEEHTTTNYNRRKSSCQMVSRRLSRGCHFLKPDIHSNPNDSRRASFVSAEPNSSMEGPRKASAELRLEAGRPSALVAYPPGPPQSQDPQTEGERLEAGDSVSGRNSLAQFDTPMETVIDEKNGKSITVVTQSSASLLPPSTTKTMASPTPV